MFGKPERAEHPMSVRPPNYWLAYFAGFFDGEGCIYLSTSGPKDQYLRVEVSMSQKDPAVLYHAARLFGGSVYKGTNAAASQWKIHGSKAIDFLGIMIANNPGLIVKQAAALMAIRCWENRKDLKTMHDYLEQLRRIIKPDDTDT